MSTGIAWCLARRPISRDEAPRPRSRRGGPGDARADDPEGDFPAALLPMIHALRLEPTQRRLDHFGEQARRIASRLEKRLRSKSTATGFRIDPKHWGAFWSAFIHALRNAVDHGLEPRRGTFGTRQTVARDDHTSHVPSRRPLCRRSRRRRARDQLGGVGTEGRAPRSADGNGRRSTERAVPGWDLDGRPGDRHLGPRSRDGRRPRGHSRARRDLGSRDQGTSGNDAPHGLPEGRDEPRSCERVHAMSSTAAA